MAVSRAAASYKNLSLPMYLRTLVKHDSYLKLPVPFFNVINGGEHSGNFLAFQEFMIVPVQAKSFEESMEIGAKVYFHLKQNIIRKYGKISIGVGDEGGFAPPIKTPEEALDLLTETIVSLGYQSQVKIALDVAASEFFIDGNYCLSKKWNNGEKLILNRCQYIEYLLNIIEKYEGNFRLILVCSIEDPFDQDDFSSWKEFTNRCTIQVVGDDLTVTNKSRIHYAIGNRLCNALLLKINQIGTVSESIEA